MRVEVRTGTLKTLAQPNLRYEALNRFATAPLKLREGRHPGFLILPRGLRAGERPPLVVVTHAADARDQFAFLGQQWAFPVQVFAEAGYAVLLFNEWGRDPAASAAYRGETNEVPVARVQQAMGLDAIAALEATLDELTQQDLIDPDRIGLAGYSRGGIVTSLALSRSSRFKAGITADTALYNAGGYFRSEGLRRAYQGLFGGPPTKPVHHAAYRALSPSWRADLFQAPLLQLMTDKVAPYALELDTALREAKVPTEFIIYPGETHLPHRPATLKAAMQISRDWFDFWLGRGCRPPAKDLCRSWDQQAASWRFGSKITASNDLGSHPSPLAERRPPAELGAPPHQASGRTKAAAGSRAQWPAGG